MLTNTARYLGINSLGASRSKSREPQTSSVFEHSDWFFSRPTEHCVLCRPCNFNNNKKWEDSLLSSGKKFVSNFFHFMWSAVEHRPVSPKTPVFEQCKKQMEKTSFWWKETHQADSVVEVNIFCFSYTSNIWRVLSLCETVKITLARASDTKVIISSLIYAVYAHLPLKVTMLPPSRSMSMSKPVVLY